MLAVSLRQVFLLGHLVTWCCVLAVLLTMGDYCPHAMSTASLLVLVLLVSPSISHPSPPAADPDTELDLKQSTPSASSSKPGTQKAHILLQDVKGALSVRFPLTETPHIVKAAVASPATLVGSSTPETTLPVEFTPPRNALPPLSSPSPAHPPRPSTPSGDSARVSGSPPGSTSPPLSPLNPSHLSLPPLNPPLSSPPTVESSLAASPSSDAGPVTSSALGGALTEPVTAPVTELSSQTADCAPDLPPGVQRWRPSTDIQINFPLTIPGACTPAEQCSVSTVLDQRVTVQTTDRVIVRFEVSVTNGGSPAAASLALRRADPGTTDCQVDHGAAPPALLVSANQRRPLGADLLPPGVNHFFGRISLFSEECFRLVVTVRSANCGDTDVPCGGRGYCVASPEQEMFKCRCCPASSGPYCEADDPCTKHPCPAGATCTTDGNSYNCTFPQGDIGPNCTLPVDPCATCLNGGTCVAGEDGTGAGPRCVCPPGYTGGRCEQRLSLAGPCLSSPCRQGVCRPEGGAARCLCPPGYGGQFCETWDACSSAPCRYGGTCHVLTLGDGGGGFNCSCPTGYRGPVCQHRGLPLCTVHPCANGGTCWDEGTYYYCTCQHGFVGKHCEVPPGVIGHFDIHHVRSGVPVMAALMTGLLIVIIVMGCCYCRSVGLRQTLGRLCRPMSRCRAAARCCPRKTYKQFSEDQRKNLLEMGYSHTHQPIVEPIFADVDYSEAAEMPLIT